MKKWIALSLALLLALTAQTALGESIFAALVTPAPVPAPALFVPRIENVTAVTEATVQSANDGGTAYDYDYVPYEAFNRYGVALGAAGYTAEFVGADGAAALLEVKSADVTVQVRYDQAAAKMRVVCPEGVLLETLRELEPAVLGAGYGIASGMPGVTVTFEDARELTNLGSTWKAVNENGNWSKFNTEAVHVFMAFFRVENKTAATVNLSKLPFFFKAESVSGVSLYRGYFNEKDQSLYALSGAGDIAPGKSAVLGVALVALNDAYKETSNPLRFTFADGDRLTRYLCVFR